MESKTINLFTELGVTDERAHEINVEMANIRKITDSLSETLKGIPKEYDRESILLGVFLCETILSDSGRLLPANLDGISVIAMPTAAKELMEELIESLPHVEQNKDESLGFDPNDN